LTQDGLGPSNLSSTIQGQQLSINYAISDFDSEHATKHLDSKLNFVRSSANIKYLRISLICTYFIDFGNPLIRNDITVMAVGSPKFRPLINQ